jgi:hypothetical protein
MLKFILQALFGVKTVDSVLGNFYKTLDDLKEVAAQNQALANGKLDASAALIKEANHHLDEVAKSTVIQSKLESLLNISSVPEGGWSGNVSQLRTENSAVQKVA